MNYKQSRGFTLIEIMLVVSLLVVVGGISAPFYQEFQLRNDLDVASNIITQTLRRAQILSQSIERDSQWGVYLSAGSVVLFKGVNYSTREVEFDEVFEISSNISFGGLQEIVYSKLYGYPQTTGTITLASLNGETKNITINSKGLVE